jgi:hypothetical protein
MSSRHSARPRVNLSEVDTGYIEHQLYIKVTPDAETAQDIKNHQITIRILKYIYEKKNVLQDMGIAVRVNKVTPSSLANPRVLEALKKRGINRLPALTTPNNVYIGLDDITILYEKNIREFLAVAGRGEGPVLGAMEEDEVARLYREELTFEKADEDAQETGIGEGDDMMDSYRRMMERREASDASRKKTGPPGVKAPARPAASAAHPPAARAPAPGGRGDNVGASRTALDDDVEKLIDRLAGGIDDDLRQKAFASGGGDSYEDDGSADPQDTLMERAYWGNQSESM